MRAKRRIVVNGLNQFLIEEEKWLPSVHSLHWENASWAKNFYKSFEEAEKTMKKRIAEEERQDELLRRSREKTVIKEYE